MFFLMICRHRDGVSVLRDAVRPSHREHVASGGDGTVKVLTGAGLRQTDAEDGIGNFGILEAESHDAALRFAQADPFFINGVVDTIELIRLADSFQDHRIDPLSR